MKDDLPTVDYWVLYNNSNATISLIAYSNNQQSLKPFKQRIQKPFIWKGNTPLSLKVSDARKAISEYKKATKDEEGMLELILLYLDCLVKCFTDFGVDDDAYFNSMYTALSDFMNGLTKANSA